MDEPCKHQNAAYLQMMRERDELRAELKRLRQWKSEALPVMSGLQDVGRALGLPLGASITGELALDAALDLRNRAEKAEAQLRDARAEESQ